MREFKIFTMIADIHIGKKSILAEDLKKELKEYYIKPMKNMKYLDAIFVLGDIMDSIVSLNSDYSELFFWFIDKIYNIAKTRKCPCIIIKGTRSHDNDQLNNIKHYELNEDNVDFRIYENIEVIKLFKESYKILLLPDIKVRDNSEIEKYFNDKYDLVLGHGTISTMQFFIQESENMPTKTYIYSLDKLLSISRGPVIFGHIHQHTNYKNKFYYAGSFDKLERGSIGNNGFLVCGISDKDKSKYKIEQYINREAANYINIKLTKELVKDSSIDDILYYIDLCMKDLRKNDLVSISIERDDDSSSIDKVLMIDSKYRYDKRVSIKKKIVTKDKEESDRIMKDKRDKYSYIMDPNLEVPEIMFRYYKEGYNIDPEIESKVEITLEEFKSILEK